MFRISRVEIRGFWGEYEAAVSLYDDVNIFIGRNGSGKTTFMDLLQAVLRVDLRRLAWLDFTSITVSLQDKQKRQTITVDRDNVGTLSSRGIVFRVNSKAYTLPVYPREYYEDSHIKRSFRTISLDKDYDSLKKTIDELINVASLSVHRATYDTTAEDDEYVVMRRQVQRASVEQRLEKLMRQLTGYRLSLAERTNQISSKFQRDVLASMLYNETFDTFDMFDPGDGQSADLGKEKEGLSKAYKELGALDDDVSEKIDRHIAALNRSLIVLHNLKRTGESATSGIQLDDIAPLPLLNRTRQIIDLSLDAQNRKREVFHPIDRFVQIVGEYMEDKRVSIDLHGDLVIQKDGTKIAVTDLSSGEKQLLILLIETLLQQNKPFIFLADEPELSLHIEWQAKIIATIRDLNPNSQIIVATHSPEIAGGWKRKIIDMEDVIHGQG